MNDNDERKRGLSWLHILCIAIVAIVLVSAVGYFVGSKAMVGGDKYNGGLNVAVPGIEPDNSAIPAYSGPPVVDQSIPTASPDNSTAATAPSVATNPMAGSVAQSDGNVIDDNGEPIPAASAAPGDADAQGTAEIADAIRKATLAALDQGGPVRWKKDGLTGYATAGTAVSTGQQTCREAYSTTLRDDGETRSPSARWCRTGDDGEWQPQ